MKLAIVIAAFNEENTIRETINSVKDFGSVIVVNDGSLDDTAKLAVQAGAIVVSKKNGGYDSALDAGFCKAGELGMSHVITFDADGQHPAKKIPEFISKLDQGCQLVIGIRNKQQRIAETIFSLYTKLFFGVNDPLCGMKAYELTLFRKIGHFDSYQSTGTELMLRYLKSRQNFAQVHIEIADRADKPRFGRSLAANIYILKSLLKGMLVT